MGSPAILLVDTESSGLIDRSKPVDDPSQPWVVSIGVEMQDIDGRTLAHFAMTVKPDGRAIKARATEIHGITARDASRCGVPEQFPLGTLGFFAGLLPYGGFVVGYGIDHDRDVVLGSMIRSRLENSVQRWRRPGLVFRDLKDACAPFCKVSDGADGFKWPTLDDAGEALCGLPRRTGHHAAYDDATRAGKVFWELVRRGVIEKPMIVERGAA